jgi:hypothetical protein
MLTRRKFVCGISPRVKLPRIDQPAITIHGQRQTSYDDDGDTIKEGSLGIMRRPIGNKTRSNLLNYTGCLD